MTGLVWWIRDLPNRDDWRCRLGLHAWRHRPEWRDEDRRWTFELCARCGWDR